MDRDNVERADFLEDEIFPDSASRECGNKAMHEMKHPLGLAERLGNTTNIGDTVSWRYCVEERSCDGNGAVRRRPPLSPSIIVNAVTPQLLKGCPCDRFGIHRLLWQQSPAGLCDHLASDASVVDVRRRTHEQWLDVPLLLC